MVAPARPAITANSTPSRSVSIAVVVAIFAAAILVAGLAIEPEQSIMMTCAAVGWAADDRAGRGHGDDGVDDLGAGGQVFVLVDLGGERGGLVGHGALSFAMGGMARR